MGLKNIRLNSVQIGRTVAGGFPAESLIQISDLLPADGCGAAWDLNTCSTGVFADFPGQKTTDYR
jgi:hypothetical protein